MENEVKKKRVLSAVQSSGTPTLGNYLGAFKNWKNMSEEFDCAFAVADLHAITVRQEPAKFRANTLGMYAFLLAIGIDPQKSPLFIQSHVHQHAELSWVLNCYTQFGELSRMTQFKDKAASHADNVNLGLFAYPTLMAADILLYNAELVPVGDDQRQHLELARNIAERFNGVYGDVFTVPEAYIAKAGARIKSLQEPTKKMSKSDPNINSFILLDDAPDVIVRKFKRAVTDSEACVCYGEGKDGVNNLIDIYSCCTGKTRDEIALEFEGKGYGDFKMAVAEAVVEELRPIQERLAQYKSDKAYLEQCYRDGAQKASYVAERTLKKVMKKVGFVL
ncbi:MAG: tryptophan--tRNA ligase [Clostridia bacterium]|nr:tryptophan--tRNA ligase [Clostridia bacterium]